MNDSVYRNRYLILIAVTGIAAIYGIVTMQILVALIVIALSLLCILGWQYLRTRRTETEIEKGEGEAVLAAGLITMVALAGMEFIVWAVGLAFLFMVHQSLARIERRLDALERREPPLP
jgi:Flp pilus assembly protein TadB